MMLIDTHCHLFYDDLKNDLPAVLDRAKKLNVTHFICVGTNVNDSRVSLFLSKTNQNIFASAGIHPHDAKDAPKDFIDQIYDLMASDRMVAVGEMGLDYYRNISNPEIQKDVFRNQMHLAQELDKPIIFHNRDANSSIVRVSGRREKSIFSAAPFGKDHPFKVFRSIFRRWLNAAETILLKRI